MKRLILSLVLLFLSCAVWAQTCPKIVKDGAVLRVTEPLGGTYQWFKNGTPIAGATADTLAPAENADYSVEVYGTSASYNFSQTPVTIQVSGQTLDRLLQPVVGVTVSFNGLSTTSDAQGRFSFPSQVVNKGRITLKYEKAGYFAAGQGLLAHQNGAMKTVVCLVDYGKPVSFKSAEGLTANTPNAKVVIPKNALVLNGQPYNDSVRFYMASFSPDDAVYGETMPGGDLFALNAQNQDVMLQSLGILNVEMRTPAGQKLELNPDSLATINFRVPKMYKTLAATQTQIPLWHYDETAQLWREEGMAVKQTNGRFEGKVGHFSWWNCDYQGPRAFVRGCITNSCIGNLAPYSSVYFNERAIVTDSIGCFFTDIPANQAYTVQAGDNSIDIVSPAIGDTLTINGITSSGINVSGFGVRSYQSGGQEVRAYVYNPVGLLPANLEYSIDSLSWQDSVHFVNVSGTISKVWIRQGSCLKTLLVYYVTINQICPLVSDSAFNIAQTYNTIQQALFAQANGQVVLKLRLSGSECDVFNQIPNLCPCIHKLDLNWGSLSEVTDEIGNLTSLKWLGLTFNNLTTLPTTIGNLINLDTLGLGNNSLYNLPSEIGNLSNLTRINVEYNYLIGLPSEIGNLSALQHLWLSTNQLTSLPPEIGNLSTLKYFSLFNNYLTTLPQEICNLKDTVTTFNVSNNPGTTAMQAQWNACP